MKVYVATAYQFEETLALEVFDDWNKAVQWLTETWNAPREELVANKRCLASGTEWAAFPEGAGKGVLISQRDLR